MKFLNDLQNLIFRSVIVILLQIVGVVLGSSQFFAVRGLGVLLIIVPMLSILFNANIKPIKINME